MSLSRPTVLAAGIAAAILTAAVLALANFAGDGENGGAGPYAVTLVASFAIAAALFGWAIPRIAKPGSASLVVGTLGVLSIAVYWSGLPFVLGPAAAMLGVLGRARAGQRGSGTFGVTLGLVATAGGIVAAVLDLTL